MELAVERAEGFVSTDNLVDSIFLKESKGKRKKHFLSFFKSVENDNF